MDEKHKKTAKKTIADELLEDDFFKPPLEEVVEEPVQENKEKQTKAEEESLLFDEFLKSPEEAMSDVHGITTSAKYAAIDETEVKAYQPQSGTKSTQPFAVATVEKTGSSMAKIAIITLGIVVLLLSSGVIYLYLNSSANQHVPSQNEVEGSQKVVINHPSMNENKQQQAAGQTSNINPQQQVTGHPSNISDNNIKEPQPQQPKQAEVAENVPSTAPATPPNPSLQQSAQNFVVMLDTVRSKADLAVIKRIAHTTNTGLKIGSTENKTATTIYALYVKTLYPSDGEATADNLKLMMAGIQNAAIVKADGGYRIFIGKYPTRAKALTNAKGIKNAGLNELIKEIRNITVTYNINVKGFKSNKEAKTFITRVRRFALRSTIKKEQ
ncbi:MAG: hypothetical protein M1381_03605 [Deltaproteobacteria bacterium]|nr:hypothetical protein [Deltaproteobacteria bacterium]MCL5792528.1 hypothetical protein [Deltaproteobacteria bacterium]